jgi:hypothetical protein
VDDRDRAQSFIDANVLLHQPGGVLVRENIVKNLAAKFDAVRREEREACAKVCASVAQEEVLSDAKSGAYNCRDEILAMNEGGSK